MVAPLFLGTADECFLAVDDSLVQSAGTGPTVTALYDGQQTCNFLDQELVSTVTSGQCCTALAVSAARRLLAFSLTGTPDRLQLVVLSPATQLTTLQQQHPAANCAYSNAAVSEDGLHLLALCGPHQPYVELWALSPLQPLLTQDVLPPGTGQCLSFHPSNSAIACSIARQQAEVLCFDKVLGQLVARKATVASATWRLEEQILCHCWTPNGMLVLGTSAGRILKAEGAVPAKGRPATTWGQDSPLTAEPLPGWECTSSILHIHLSQRHLVVMYASAGSGAAASAIWLDNHSLQQIARLALPTNICHAWTDFGLSKAIASTTCGSVFTFPVHPQGEPASLTLVSRQHVKEVIGLAFLSATSMISACQDGVTGLWQVQKDPSGVLTVQLCGMQSVACNITCITAQPDCSAAVIGLSSGQLLRLVVSQSTAATAHSNSSAGHIDELSTGISGVSNDHATETGSSLSAALDIVPIPRQHNAAVSAAQVSPNGQLLASLSAPDGVIVFREYSASATSFHVVSEAALPGASCLAWLPAMGRDTCQRLLLGCNDGQLVVMAAATGSTPGGAWEQQPLWRLQSAPLTLHLTSADSVRSSTGCVYMYAALLDKSLHKYKLVVPTTMPAAQAKVLPLLSPERGFPMQKGCRALLIDKLGRLLAAASDGCCYLLDAESLHQDARLILHPSQTGGISAIACSQDGLIACGSPSGVISLSPTGRTSPSAMRLLPPHQSLATPASWGPQEAHGCVDRQVSGGAQLATLPPVAQEEQAALRQQLHSLKTRVETAVQLNSSLEPELQLAPQALTLNTDLRDQLLSKGRANVSALRHALQHEQLTDQVKAARIKAACWDTMATPQAVILPVSQTCLTTGLGEFEPSDEMVTRFTIWSLGPVHNMPISKLSAEEARRLQQVQHLRQMELNEWQARDTMGSLSPSGTSTLQTATTDASNAGNTSRKQSMFSSTGDLSRSITGSAAGPGSLHEDCDRGRSGILYGSMELHTPARQISQAVLLQHEARLIREAFNQQFEMTQAAKKDLIASLDERLARITNIERELGLHPQAVATSETLEDLAPDGVLTVDDIEVKADRWVSPDQLKQQQAEQQAAAATASHSQKGLSLRGIRQMLGDQGGVQGRSGQAQVVPLELARQPWMDLPDSVLTPQQRAALKEHDKKVQDWMQQQQRHRAALETELKTLRLQIGKACFAFDDSLIELQISRNSAESEMTTVELQQISLAAFFEQQQYLHAELEKVAQQLSRVHKDLDAKQTMVSDVSSALIKAQGHLEEVQPQGRAVDKAFKRELGPLPYYSDLLQLYQDRTRGYTYQADFRMAELDQMLTTTSSPSPQEQQLQAPVLGVPFVQRILHERRAASQSAQSGTDAPSKHVSLSHQPSPVPSPRSPSRASLVPPSGFTTPGRLSRSPSMCPTPKSPGHRLSLLPASTSRSSFLMPKVTEAEEALLELKELGPLGIPPSSPLSAACNPFATQLVLKAFTDMPAVPTDPEALSGALLGSEDMPRLCKPEHWARLVALRDARVSLESDTAQLGNTVQLLSDQLVVLQDEQACLVSQLEAAEQAEVEWSNELRHYQSDLQVRFRVQAGQVEAADRHPLTDQSDMLLMDRQEVALLNSLILNEGQAKLAQQKAVWTAERQSLVAHWEQQHLSLQIQAEQAHLQDVHLLHLSHDSPYRNSGGGKVLVKKETTAALIQKQQGRQQADLAIVYERELALERAVAKRGQENAEQSAVKNLLADEVAAVTKIYEPIKDRAGDERKRLDASMRQSHAVHVLREISHHQQADIQLMKHEIARLSERSKASFALQRPVQPDITYST